MGETQYQSAGGGKCYEEKECREMGRKVREGLLEETPEQSEGVSHKLSGGRGVASAKALRSARAWHSCGSCFRTGRDHRCGPARRHIQFGLQRMSSPGGF